METAMVVQPPGPKRSLVIPAGERITLAILRVCQEDFLESKGYEPEDLPENIQLLFSMAEMEVLCLFPPNQSTLHAVNLVREIQNCDKKGLMRNCFIEGKARELLSLKLQRPLEEECCGLRGTTPFAAEDVLKITQARNILISDLKNAPTIKELAKLAGLNRQKLKQQFKQVFGKTIFQYLREERMITAKSLLMGHKKLTIQEVAAEVGYENPSHFSARFREQFGLLPSEFQAMVCRWGQDN